MKMCKAYDISALALLFSLSLFTPLQLCHPPFSSQTNWIHSEPWQLFIPVVRMSFLKYLYREDISLSFSRCRLSLRLPLFKYSLITVLSLLPDILISLFFCMIITRTVYFLTLHISHQFNLFSFPFIINKYNISHLFFMENIYQFNFYFILIHRFTLKFFVLFILNEHTQKNIY